MTAALAVIDAAEDIPEGRPRRGERRSGVGRHRHQQRQRVPVGGPGVGVPVRDPPGQNRHRRGRRYAAQHARGGIQRQAGGQGAKEFVAQGAIAAGGGRQSQGHHLVRDVSLRRHHGHAEIRRGVGLHRHRHDQPSLVAWPGVLVRIRGRPGQRDGRGHAGRGAGQGARGGIQGQPVGQVPGGRQRIGQAPFAAGGRRQVHGWSGHVHGVDQVHRHGRAETRRGTGVGDRDLDTRGGDVSVSAHRMDDGNVLVVHVVVPAGLDGYGLRGIPGRGGEGQRPGDPDAAARGDHRRRHRDLPGGGGIQPDGVGGDRRGWPLTPAIAQGEGEVAGEVALGHGEARGTDDDPRPLRRGGQTEAVIGAGRAVGGAGHAGKPGHGKPDGSRRGHRHAEGVAGTHAGRDGDDPRLPAGRQRPGHLDVPWSRFQNAHVALTIPRLHEIKVQQERAAVIAGQLQRPRQIQPIKQPGRQGGEPIVPQIQARQPAESVEVVALEPGDALALQGQRPNGTQVGRGHNRAARPGGCAHNGVAHRRGAAADGRQADREGERQVGGVLVDIRHRPGVDTRRRDCRRRAGQNARATINRQPGGQGRGQHVAQGKVAGGGGRQAHGRHLAPDTRPQRPDPLLAEVRDHIAVVVADRHHDGPGSDAPVADDRMRDGGGFVQTVHVLAPADGHPLREAPVHGGKGQRAGDRHRRRDRVDRRRHDHVAGGGGVQPHGIGAFVAFAHREDGGNVDHGTGRRDAHRESPVAEHRIVRRLGRPGEREREGSGRDRHRIATCDPAELGAGALACRNGGGAIDHDWASQRPVERDRQRGGGSETRLENAIFHPIQFNVQREHAAGGTVAVQAEAPAAIPPAPQVAQPVKQPVGQGGKRVVRQIQVSQRAQPAEQIRGQGGEYVAAQIQVGQRAQPVEHIRGQGGERVAAQIQRRQGTQPVEVADPELHHIVATQVQAGDPAQVGHGHQRAVRHPGPGHNGRAHRRGAGAEIGAHTNRERETGRVAIVVGDNPGIRAHPAGHGWRAGQHERVGIQRQPGGQRLDNRILQRRVASGGFRQHHGRHGAPFYRHQGRHRRRAKIRLEVGVGNRDREAVGRGDRPVAPHRMVNDGGVGAIVHVLAGHDGDGLRAVPVRDGEGQGTGDGERATARKDRRRHRDVARGKGVQPHEIGGGAVLAHGEGVGHDHPGPGPPRLHPESGIGRPRVEGVVPHIRKPEIAEHNRGRR